MKFRNNQLQLYEGNWAAFEIMKTIIRNKRNYRTKISHLDTTPDQTKSPGSQQASACGAHGTSNGASDENEGFSNSDVDDGNKENSDAVGGGGGTGSVGKKRKVTRSGGSGGSGGKGKQRKL